MREAVLASRAEAAYLGLALGDALGATVEFLIPAEIRQQHGIHREIRGGGWLRLKAGAVTDDTTMSLALGEAILAEGGEVSALAAARAFDGWMRGKPVDIGNTVRRNLVRFRQTGDPVAPPSEHDAGNGALMRVLPVALATWGRTPAEVAIALRAQGQVTHNNALSDAASEAFVGALHDIFRGAGIAAVWRRADALATLHPVFAWRGRRREQPSGYVVETVQAVWQALLASDSFEDALVDVVNRGGDADTTGALCGMLAGALYGRDALPQRWLRVLDPTMRHRCEEQAKKLMECAENAAARNLPPEPCAHPT